MVVSVSHCASTANTEPALPPSPVSVSQATLGSAAGSEAVPGGPGGRPVSSSAAAVTEVSVLRLTGPVSVSRDTLGLSVRQSVHRELSGKIAAQAV